VIKDLYYYKSNAEDVFNRMNRLYDDAYNHRGGNLLFRVLLQSDIDVYTKIKINKYNYEIEADKYSRDICDILFDSFEARKDVLDDAIPSLSVNLGIGDYSAFVTGDIYFSSDTSWSRPTLKNLKDFRNIEPLGTAPWYKKILTDMRIYYDKHKAFRYSLYKRLFLSPGSC
jgi:hypothetical protein